VWCGSVAFAATGALEYTRYVANEKWSDCREARTDLRRGDFNIGPHNYISIVPCLSDYYFIL
jgi:hypothetical protein